MMCKLIQMKSYFSEIGFQDRLPHLAEFYQDDYIHGHIYKKAQFFNRWDRRFIIINKKGLFSFKDHNDTKPSFIIKAEDVKDVWTRFHIEMGDLVVKIMHGSTKT